MKKLVSILLALSLLAAGIAALAEGEPEVIANPEAATKAEAEAEDLTFGYLAPTAPEGTRGALCKEAFAYAAERKGVATVLMAYDPEDVPPETPAPEASADETIAPEASADETVAPEASATADAAEEVEESPAMRALAALLESEPDGVVIVPESMEQAKELAELAAEKKVPVVIEGVDMRSAYAPPEKPEDPASLPYVAAVDYSDAASYAAAMWLDENAYSPMALHCALPEVDSSVRAGLERALQDCEYLQIVNEIEAGSDSASYGREAVNLMFGSYTTFGCVLADSVKLAEGSAAELRSADEDMEVAAIARSAEDIQSLNEGVDMLAFAPAAVEGVACFRALYDFATEQVLPEAEGRMLYPAAVVATKGNIDGWIKPDDYAAAYALAYPDDELPEAEATEAPAAK